MKKNIFNTFGLLFCACGLVTGCYNGWSTNGTPRPSSEPEPVVSSSSEEEVLPDEDFQVDLSYPLKDTPLVSVSEEEFKEEILKSTGSAMLYDSMRSFLGDYFMDFVLTHNHMTIDELEMLLASLWDFSIEVDNGDYMTYYCIYDLAYTLAYVDADRLFSTVKEVFDDGVAWGYFINLLVESDYCYDYINSDYILNGSNSTIRNLADKEKRVLATDPYAVCDEGTVRFLADIAAMENGHVFFRFLHRFFRSMIRHLDKEEVGFVFYNTFLAGAADPNDFEKVMEYVYGEGITSLLRLVHHIGGWLSEINVNAKTYEACYPSFYNIFIYSLYNSFDLRNAFFVDTTWLEDTINSVSSLFTELNPEGLRSLFKFLGLVGSNCTEEQLAVAMGEAEEPNVDLLVDLYNEQYGMLTASEKVGMTEAAAAFGVDFDLVIEKLKEFARKMSGDESQGFAMRDDSGDDEESIEDILNEYIVYKFMERFTFENPDVFSGDRYSEYSFIVRQGQNITNQMFEEYLVSGVCPAVAVIDGYFDNNPQPMTRDDGYYDYTYEQRDENGKFSKRVLKSVDTPFDTSTCGVHEVTFSLRTEINYQGVPVTIDVQLTTEYHVVPNDVDTIYGVPYGASIYYHGNWMSKYIYTDSSGNKFACHHDTLYVEYGKSYAANEYCIRLEGGTAIKKFDDNLQRYVATKNRSWTQTTSNPLWLNNVDTSSLGSHFTLVDLNYYSRDYSTGTEEFFATMKCCLRYVVVESITEIPGVDLTAPIK